MIVSMKKIHLVLQDKDAIGGLEVLREAGMLHLEHQKKPEGGEIPRLKEEIGLWETVGSVLAQHPALPQETLVGNGKDQAREVLEGTREIERVTDNMAKRQTLINQWKPWGDFDPAEIKELKEKGIEAAFYEIPEARLPDLPSRLICRRIFSTDKIARCLVISQQEIQLPYHRLTPPETGLAELKRLQEQARAAVTADEQKIRASAKYLEGFQNILLTLQDRFRLEEAFQGQQREDSLSLIKGYCPADQCRALKETARKNQWALVMEDPSEDEHPPTLLKNPKWLELVKPLYNMINVLPGYEERDISVPFLFFFTLFFGMLVGDAGYGILVFLGVAAAHVSLRKKITDAKFFYLMYLLCGSTILWGVLTGTYFGQKWIPEGTIEPLAPWLNDTDNLQMFCFLIGAVHLSMAHLWRAVLLFPSAMFLSQLGWFCVVWMMFFVAKMLVLGDTLPDFALPLGIAGSALIIFFTSPNKNPLKAIGPGMGDFLLNIINAFTDIVSYIRLYAVGLATVAVADAANDMSFFWTIFLHTLNMILAAMAILVHGLRLNVLEFSGHMGMEWSGEKYSPFKRIKKA